MSTLAELWEFVRERKKFWLMPVFLMILVFGGLEAQRPHFPDAADKGCIFFAERMAQNQNSEFLQ